jgi:hypothetical protein
LGCQEDGAVEPLKLGGAAACSGRNPMATPGTTVSTLISLLNDLVKDHGDQIEVGISVSISDQLIRLDVKGAALDSKIRGADEPPLDGDATDLLWIITSAPPADVNPLAPQRARIPRVWDDDI